MRKNDLFPFSSAGLILDVLSVSNYFYYISVDLNDVW